MLNPKTKHPRGLSRPRTMVLPPLVALVIVALTSCAGVSETESAANIPPELNFVQETPADKLPDPIVLDPNESNDEAFQFVATELETGNAVNGSYLFDRKPLIMVFVTPTCPVCVAEADELLTAADANPDITYVVVHSGGSQGDYMDFVDAAQLRGENIVNLNDADGSLLVRFRILSVPSNILVDNDGRLTSSVGALDEAGLERAADLLLS